MFAQDFFKNTKFIQLDTGQSRYKNVLKSQTCTWNKSHGWKISRALLDLNKLHFNWSLVLYFISTPDWITFRHVNDTVPTRNETLIVTAVSWCQTSLGPSNSIRLTCVNKSSLTDSVFRRPRRPHRGETWWTMMQASAIMRITSPEWGMPTSILTRWWWVLSLVSIQTWTKNENQFRKGNGLITPKAQ